MQSVSRNRESSETALTASHVPGRKIMVKMAIDRMYFESLLVESAISTFVSPDACSKRVSNDVIVNHCILSALTHCVAIAMPSTRMEQSLTQSSYSSLMASRRVLIRLPVTLTVGSKPS